jgi:RNA polymerase sigma-70 factor (ECF subfamily)
MGMQEYPDQVARINELLERHRQGDKSARGELLDYAGESLRKLIKKIYHRDDQLHRWELTDDVRQNLAIRLLQALDEVKPESALHFFRLANQHIRWTLRDLAKHYYGPYGMGSHHDTDKDPLEGPDRRQDSDFDWDRFDGALNALSEEEQNVFNLCEFEELPLTKVAKELEMSYGTVKIRYRTARLKLWEALRDEDRAHDH